MYLNLITSQDRFVSEINLYNNLVIYANLGQQVLVRLFDINPVPVIEYRCNVQKLELNYPIIAGYFCVKFSLNSPEKCFDINNNNKLLLIKNKPFKIHFNKFTGFNLTSSETWINFSPGFYYCKLKTDLESLETNFIEFKSFSEDFSGEIQPNKLLNVYKQGLPNQFHCGINMLNNSNYEHFQYFYPVFQWHACPISHGYKLEHTQCLLKPNSQLEFRLNKDYFQHRNGSIALSPSFLSVHSKFGLICTLQNTPTHFYSRFIIDMPPLIRTAEQSKIFEISTPLMSDVFVKEGLAPSYQYKLLAGYRVHDNMETEFHWSKDNFDLPSAFIQSSNELIFPDKIEIYHQGTYKLAVVEIKSGQIINFLFNVTVIGFPKLKNGINLPTRLFTFPDETVDFTIEFEGYNIIPILTVNDMKMNLSTKILKKQSIELLKHKFSYFSNVSFDMSESMSAYQASIHYVAKNLQPLKHNNRELHLINILANNPAGVAKIRTIIEILDKPKWKISLGNSTCNGSCSNNSPQEYKCEIYKEPFISRDIQIEYDWYLNNLPIVGIKILENKYIIDNNKLVFKNLKNSDEEILKILNNFTLSCQVSLAAPRFLINSQPIYERIYSSNREPFISSISHASIQLKFVQPATFKTSLFILCLGIFLIILFVLITVVWINHKVRSKLSEFVFKCRNPKPIFCAKPAVITTRISLLKNKGVSKSGPTEV